MRTVELFSGTRSFSKVAQARGHETFTVELDEYFEADLHKNILDLKAKDFPKDIDVLWASPPCTAFSVASIGSSWCGKLAVKGKEFPAYCPKRVESALGMAYVLKTLQLIKELKPKYWFIENPRGVLRKMSFMGGLDRKSITYCQYGDNRMKPTDIWTNCSEWIPKPMCKNGMSCHESAPRGSKTGTQGLGGAKDRSRIPSDLFNELFEVLE